MARRRAAQHCKILPWLSAKNNCQEGRFLQVGNSLLLNKEFQKLPDTAKHLYQCMAMESGGRPDFVFPLTAAKKYGISETTFRRHVKSLSKAGFISVESNANLRKPNKYKFTSYWKEARPP